jgi:hypothetical protein
MENSWQLGTTYYKTGPYVIFSQPGGPFTPVFPAQNSGAIWDAWPGPESMVFAYGPWIIPGCGHGIHEYKIIQEYDYDMEQPVQLLACNVCTYVQRAVYGVLENGMPELYDSYLYCVIVA